MVCGEHSGQWWGWVVGGDVGVGGCGWLVLGVSEENGE